MDTHVRATLVATRREATQHRVLLKIEQHPFPSARKLRWVLYNVAHTYNILGLVRRGPRSRGMGSASRQERYIDLN